MIETVDGVRVPEPLRLELTFDAGERRRIDVDPLLDGEVFCPLGDHAFFARVTVDEHAGTIVWPNGADLAPGYRYYDEPREVGDEESHVVPSVAERPSLGR